MTSMSTTAPSTATSSGFAVSSGSSTPTSTQSRRSMASDTASTMSEEEEEEAGLRLSWSGRWTLGHRILAVNILTLVLLALSVLYLDAYRNRLSRERTRQTRIEAT